LEGAVERAAYFVGGTGAALINKDAGARNAVSQHEFGFVRLPVALFEPIYTAAEPHFLGDIEQPIATTDLIPLENSAGPNCIVNGRSLRAWSIS